MDLVEALERYRAEEKKLHWEGTFKEYFNLVAANPKPTQLSHARVYDMIMAHGVEEGEDGIRRYKFFTDELYGLDRTLEQLVSYFHSAAKRLDVHLHAAQFSCACKRVEQPA